MQHPSWLIGITTLFLLLSGCGWLGGTSNQGDALIALQQTTTAQTQTAVALQPPPTVGPSATPTPSPTPSQASSSPAGQLLAEIMRRGRLICGVNGYLPGFSQRQADGSYTGFDVDFCRVVATAIFGNAQAVEFRSFERVEDGLAAVQAGELDLLLRNATWTADRDIIMGLDFGPTVFHDGQGIMVRASLNITRVEELAGHPICVQRGTTSELNVRDLLKVLKIAASVLVQDDVLATYAAYDAGQCDAVTSDRSQLVTQRTTLANPDEHVLLEYVLSREPLSPVFRQGDNQWRDVVSWAIFATIYAEELDVTSTNMEQRRRDDDPRVDRLLGDTGDFGRQLGLSNDFARSIITQVGNYGEIYNRNLGPTTPFNLDRGPNKAWNLGRGGVLSSPPFR